MIEAGRADAVLVAAGEHLTRYLDQDDRRTAALIGDGAGAVVLTATDGPGRIGPCVLRADGRSREIIYMTRGEAKLRMEGQQTFAMAVEYLCTVTEQALAAADLTLDEIDLFVYHQANGRILKAVGERLGLPQDRVVDCIEQLGNTSAASIPLALDTAERDGRLVDGMRLLLGSVGAGFTWGATVVEWGRNPD
jgi:3-oxoacyl-[acyl-carrier-protein] synthase III